MLGAPKKKARVTNHTGLVLAETEGFETQYQGIQGGIWGEVFPPKTEFGVPRLCPGFPLFPHQIPHWNPPFIGPLFETEAHCLAGRTIRSEKGNNSFRKYAAIKWQIG
jgi:hypothetical protein